MSRLTLSTLASAAALVVCACPSSAFGAETQSADLLCGGTKFVVTGFGRGEVLHVVGSNANFVVTFAQIVSSGRVVIDIPGQTGVDVITCTTTTPSGTDFTFKGFFTPRS